MEPHFDWALRPCFATWRHQNRYSPSSGWECGDQTWNTMASDQDIGRYSKGPKEPLTTCVAAEFQTIQRPFSDPPDVFQTTPFLQTLQFATWWCYSRFQSPRLNGAHVDERKMGNVRGSAQLCARRPICPYKTSNLPHLGHPFETLCSFSWWLVSHDGGRGRAGRRNGFWSNDLNSKQRENLLKKRFWPNGLEPILLDGSCHMAAQIVTFKKGTKLDALYKNLQPWRKKSVEMRTHRTLRSEWSCVESFTFFVNPGL